MQISSVYSLEAFFCNNEQMCVTRELCNLYKAEVKKKGGRWILDAQKC